jgi:hypothetical protein
MKHKAIKIDWDDLEEAFSNPDLITTSYLDRVTGRVVLEGEEDDDFDEDEAAYENPMAVAAARTAVEREDPTRVPIRPPDTERKIGWLKAFLEQTAEDHDATVIAELKQAIGADNPAEAIGDVLSRNSEVRDAWYLYRSDRLHDLMDEWLVENELESTDPAPWK